MKLRTATNIFTTSSHAVDGPGAVQEVVSRAAQNYEGELERERAGREALQGVLGRLIGALCDNDRLTTDQVAEIFDYDVIAEE